MIKNINVGFTLFKDKATQLAEKVGGTVHNYPERIAGETAYSIKDSGGNWIPFSSELWAVTVSIVVPVNNTFSFHISA